MSARKATALIPVERILRTILVLRGQKVMLDSDLAALYGVSTKVLNQAVRRNRERFPDDFMFRLDNQELANLRSQIVTSSYGGRRYAPYAFTREGVAMLSGVLKSRRAIQVNVEIMRAFVHLHQLLAENAELAQRVNELELKYDSQFKFIFEVIQQLTAPPEPLPEEPKRRIGFHVQEKRAAYKIGGNGRRSARA